MNTKQISNALLADELSGREYSLAKYGGQAYYEDFMFDHWLECDGKHYFVLLYMDYFTDRFSRDVIKFSKGPFELNRQMNPVDFAMLGNEDMNPPEALVVTPGSDDVVWKTPHFEVHCEPPVWRVKGRREDVALDLTYQSCIPTFIVDGGVMGNNVIGRALWNWADVSGTFELAGKVLEVTGKALHEHTMFQQLGWKMKFDWLTGFFDHELYFVLHTQPVPEQAHIRSGSARWVSPQGTELFNFEDVTIEPVASWSDPGLGQEITQQWRAVARSARATLSLDVYALTRIWHIVPRPDAAYVLVDYNLMLEGEWIGPDGVSVPLSGGRGYLQSGWPKDMKEVSS